MAGVLFYLVLTVLALTAIAAEAWVDERQQRGWHHPPDTLANVNLAAGNLVVGTVLAAAVLAGLGVAYRFRIVDLGAWLPGPVFWGLGFLATELCQYWQHRLSHRWNVLAWGHDTHHSSSRFNLSTAIRVNWLYRGYAWLFYLPLPLVGVTVEQFVVYQGLMNVYNLYCHTRVAFPRWERLGWLLVTPEAHRLHHSADPQRFGNYGASLVIWDRLFGTYVRPRSEEELSYGLPASGGDRAVTVDSASPWSLNFAHVADIQATAAASRQPASSVWLSDRPAEGLAERVPLATSVPRRAYLAVAVAVAVAVVVQLAHVAVPWPVRIGLVVAGLVAVTGAAGTLRGATAG